MKEPGKDDNTRERLQDIARMIDEELPDGWGFALFAFPFNDPDGRCNYIAKGERESIVAVMRQWLDKQAPTDCGPDAHWSDGIHWVICGGESGPKKRPINCDWARSLKGQCQDAGVPFFMKQIDKVQPIPEDLMIREFPDAPAR